MSERAINELFFRIPYTLLRVPAFMKHFDFHSRGGMYRILSSTIYRRSVSQLKFVNDKGYITELARRYDQGWLCAFLTDAELSEALDLTVRRIEDLRKELFDCKLIKFEKFQDGYIYTLGVVNSYVDEDGFRIGKGNESMFMDEWIELSQSDEGKDLLEFIIIEKLAPKKQRELFFGKHSEKYFEDLRKKFREMYQKSSKIQSVPERKKVAKPKPPIEDNIIEHLKDNTAEVKPQADRSFDLSSIKNQNDFEKANRSCRVAITKGLLTRSQVDELLFDKLTPEGFRSKLAPRFSYYIQTRKESKQADEVKLMKAWSALKEDIQNLTLPQGEFGKGVAMIRNWIQQGTQPYSAQQYYWTMVDVVRCEEKNTFDFMLQRVENFIYVVKNRNDRYKEYLNQQRNDRVMRERQEEIQKQKEQDEEKTNQQSQEPVKLNPIIQAMLNKKKKE